MRWLAVVMLVGCGAKSDSNPGEGPIQETADPGETAAPVVGLQVGAMTMELAFTWDGSAVVVGSETDGTPLPSRFRMNFGPLDWDGDTSVPQQPYNWCHVEWSLVGLDDRSMPDGAFLALEGLTTGATTCGQESSPGAGDAVPLANDLFGGQDLVQALGGPDWVFATGVGVDAGAVYVVEELVALGYAEDEVWGGEIRNEPVMGTAGPSPSVVYGWQTDAGVVVEDVEGNPVRQKVGDQGSGALQPGHYVHVVPGLFRFQ